MKHTRTWMATLLLGTLLALPAVTPAQVKAEVALRAAMETETVKGDLKSAIEQYKKIAQGGDRALAAKALVRMGECYQKLGDAESRTVYERVVREFADQVESATEARTRLAAMQSPASPQERQAARLIWSGVQMHEGPVGVPSADGRYLSFTADHTGDLAVRDLREGTHRLLTHNGRWIDQYAENSAVSPDGRKVAYSWWDFEAQKRSCCGYDLRILPVSGGEAAKPQIVHRSDETRYIEVFGWTPDGKSLLVVRQLQDRTYQIAVISIADGSVRVLKSLEWRQPGKVSLSPDGRSIAYDAPAAADMPAKDIFLLAADGSRETVVVQNPADDYQPVWSPDGSQILFVSNRTGNNSLWAVHIDAGQPRGSAELVKPGIGRLMGMTRSGALYYLSGGPTLNIYTVEVDANVKVKTAPSLATDRFINSNCAPAWSPDGQYLAYYSVRSPVLTVLVIRSLKTGEERDIASGLRPAGSELFPGFSVPVGVRWFPDSRSVLVVSRDLQRDRLGLYRVDIATGSAELLLHVNSNISRYRLPDLSPDGKSIFYLDSDDDRGGASPTIRLMRFDMDSRRETPLKEGPEIREIRALAVSPDGAQLAYSLRASSDDPLLYPHRLEVMPVGGGEPRLVFRIPDSGGGVGRFQLAWTPDQRYLLFVTESNYLGRVADPNRGRAADLWRVPVAGGEAEHTGVSVRGMIRSPGMHPDGHRITFESLDDTVAHELWSLENFLPKTRAGR